MAQLINFTDLICNHKQEIVSNTTAVITGVSIIKRLNLYEITLLGRDLVSVVRIIEVFILENIPVRVQS